jgi:hypothetical protein
MPRPCAFCPSTANISGEHVWSDWMSKIFPLGNVQFQRVAPDGTVLSEWKAPELNLTANVVCKPCNETWMSDIEWQYAKPAMSDLILGKHVGAIGNARARGIAIFAFKTAVIGNHMLPENEEFFEVQQRYAFRESLLIPPKVAMWFFGCAPEISGRFRDYNVKFTDKHKTALTLNVCTFSVGQFGFQVVAAKTDSVPQIESLPTHPGLTVPFHPILGERVSWPRNVVLGGEAFDNFHARWNKVRFS